ncbi:MAG: hypothetical protein K0M70_03055 [Arenimonas sp.]|uniref:hypothetical protein n=1 Tax=Arenimonas sp. TaxID=1872635 RepID=UPI0025C6A3AA|nr:hypothetical protein [Arenimonas sp.]MBW8366821.1 hypothetical protein [Arenimonas sp.]
MKHTATLALLLASLLATGTAQADARADLKEAFLKFMKVKTFRATITNLDTNTEVSKLEFVFPDRYSVTLSNAPGRQVIIGRTMHMTIEGHTFAVPLPPEVDPSQYRHPKAIEELQAGINVKQLENALVAGEPSLVYYFLTTVDGKAMETLTYVSKKTGLPIQVETTGGVEKGKFRYQIRYSQFNDPSIEIKVPN